MNDVNTLTRQHLIDPTLCIRCDGCAQVCEQQAVQRDHRSYAVDPLLCNGCMACVEQCPTGAANHWRWMPSGLQYSVEEQLRWDELPPPELAGVPADPAAAAADTPPRPGPVVDRHAPAIGRVLDNRRVTPAHAEADIHHIVLAFDGTAPQPFEGQAIGIVPPGVDAHGQPHRARMYSVASPRSGEQHRPGTLALTVKRVTQDAAGRPMHGLCSNHLCDLAPGATVPVMGPYGPHDLLPDDPTTRLVLVAAGTGIAPMRAMLARRRALHSDGADRIVLFYGGRQRDELPYVDELAAAASAGQLTLHLALSRVPGQPKHHVQDLLLAQAPHWLAWLADDNGHLYACGPRGLREGLTDALTQACQRSGRAPQALMQRLTDTHRLHIETY